MSRVPPFPNREAFFDAKGAPTPDLQKFIDTVQVAWPVVKWFQQIQRSANNASDQALFGATADDTARGALTQQARDEADLALHAAEIARPIPHELLSAELAREGRQALPDDEARLLATLPPSARGDDFSLFSLLQEQNPRSDFRAFVLEETHANRLTNFPAAAFEIGQLFWETDRTALYIVQLVTNVRQWVYAAGVYSDVLANIPVALTANDVGFRFAVTDYSHELRWTGSAWLFAPGDDSAYMAFGKPDGSAPNGGVWGLCNGSTYAVLKSDGTTENLVTDDLTGDVFLRGGTPAGVKVASALKWAAGDKTDLANTGGSVSTASASVNAGAGAPATFLTSASFNEGNHQHGLSDANAPMNVPDETNGGLPKRANVKVYLRR